MAVSEVHQEVDKLLEIPEIKQAMKRYQEILAEYHQAVRAAVIAAPGDELPDIDEIKADYDPRLDAQRAEVMSLVRAHV